ncbi:MAG: CHAD domain-containing protein [Pararhodobacter sp.]|nr:CHAD domain-containing protein [Pararhodobacter sp.]
MPFEFKPDDASLLKGVQRLARGQLDAALALLESETPPTAETVHALRKHSKKLRGLLRLMAPVMKGCKRQNARLRDAARHIAPLRDAEVRLATFDLLAREMRPDDGQAALRALLQQDLDSARQPENLAQICGAMRAEFRAVRASVDDWALRKPHARAGSRKADSAQAFAVLRPGLENTWRQAQQGLHAARAALAGDFPAEPFHAWRKHAKHHWYQARLIQPVWPRMMAPHVAAADMLGELLGGHNDLDVLCDYLRRRTASDDAAAGAVALPALQAAALQPRRLLAERAVALGGQLFAPPARAMTDLWGAWWCVWRA